MEKVMLGDIKVDERVRKEYNDIDKLADSIRKYGLLQPIVIDSDNTLIAGGRRLKALERLKWRDVPVVRKSELTPDMKLEMELEENLQRRDLTWQEEVLAKKRLFELREKLYGKSVVDFAEELGESAGKTSQDLQLAKKLEDGDETLWEFDKKSKAMFFDKCRRQKKMYAALNTIMEPVTDKSLTLLCGDSRELLPGIEQNIACIVTDIPFGVSYKGGEWNDDWEIVAPVVTKVLALAFKKLLPDSHAYICFGMSRYVETRKLLQSIGFKVNPLPIIVQHRKSTGALLGWDMAYSPWFFCKKGNRYLNADTALENFIPVEAEDLIVWHPTAKPVLPIIQFLRASTLPGETVLDPFAGSGSTGVACKSLKRMFVGIEKDPVYFPRLKERLS
jgi:ParB/RepB/Spo0J family partition protein